MNKFASLLFFIFCFYDVTYSQFSVTFKRSNGFIANAGQFDKNRDWQLNQSILDAYDANLFYVFFSKKGITYRISKLPNQLEKNHKNNKTLTLT